VTRLAEKSGISKRTMANYCEGASEPRVSDLVQIARRNGVAVTWLACGEGPMRAGNGNAEAAAQAPIPFIRELLEETVMGIEDAAQETRLQLTPRQRAVAVSTLYGILWRRHAVRLAGGMPLDVDSEGDMVAASEEGKDLMRLLMNAGPPEK